MRIKFCLFLLAFFLPFFAAKADLPVPSLEGRVTDHAGLLPAAERTRVENAILALEKASGGQMAVLIIPSLQGDSIDAFSIRVAENWKIGKKGKDNGAILIVSRDDRKIRLEVGYGWEGQVNDARAGDIIRGMGPFFKAGEYGDGLCYAVQKFQSFLGMGAVPPEKEISKDKRKNVIMVISLFGLLVVFLIVVFSDSRRSGVTYARTGWNSGGSSWGGGFGRGGGGGGFSGGGGGFGGGGASGGW